MIDILLVNPRTSPNIENNEPLNLLSLAAYLLNSGFSVEIYDEFSPLHPLQEMVSRARYVGITSNTCSYSRAVELAREIKGLKPEAPIIAGGVHPTTMPEDALRDGFDIVVAGEGERTLVEILGADEREGVFAGKVITEEEFYRPARHLVDMEFYVQTKIRCPSDPNLNFVPYNNRMACYLTSRGCPYQCIFCHNIWRRTKLRFVPVDRVVEELEYLKRDHGVSAVWLMDDHIFINKKRARKLLQAMIDARLGLIWASATRADAVDDEMLALAHEAGCRRLAIGVESGSQRVLDRLEKRLSVEKNMHAIRLCRKHGIRTVATFMVGNPGETKQDVKKSMDFILKSKTHDLAVSILTPFPGSKLWKMCEEQGRIPDAIDFSQFNYLKAPIQVTDHISQRELEALKRKMLIRFYLQPNQVLSMARKFLVNPRSMVHKVIEYF